MKILRTVQKNFAFFGIGPNQLKFNKRLVITWLILSLATIAGAMFIAFEAKTFQEYTTDLYTASGGAIITAILTILIVKMEKLFKLIDDIQQTISKSELNFEF